MRLETNDAGTAVTGVVVERDGARETYTGDIVVVSCGAANSAKLLLASASDAHPNGLANGSDQVGRNYMFHNCVAVLALSKEPNPTVFQKTLGLNDFYFGTDDVDYPLGNIQMVGKSSAEMYRGEKPIQTRLAPEWTLEKVARHAVDFWLSTEDLPRAGEPRDPARRRQRRARLHGDQRRAQEAAAARAQVDAQGTSGCSTTTCSRATPTSRTTSRWRAARTRRAPAASATDPADSVLDTDCRAHEVDNLYVVDTSFFPSIGAVNPALTAMANAVRVGDHLLRAHGRSAGRTGARACRLT